MKNDGNGGYCVLLFSWCDSVVAPIRMPMCVQIRIFINLNSVQRCNTYIYIYISNSIIIKRTAWFNEHDTETEEEKTGSQVAFLPSR